MSSVRVLHIITGLNTGGAEMMLYRLLSRRDESQFVTKVISLLDPGPIGDKIKQLGIQVRTLGMTRGVPCPRALYGLMRLVSEYKPDIIQTWMYHADLMGGLVGRLVGVPVIWGIRQADTGTERNKKMTAWTARVCAVLSSAVPDVIVSCAEAARKSHSEFGYQKSKIRVIHNGFDTEAFRPDLTKRKRFRAENEIPETAFVVGMVGRFDAQKDHKTFVESAHILSAAVPQTHFVLCGDNVVDSNPELSKLRDNFELQNVHLLGHRSDMPNVMAGLDVLASSSLSEGFSNVLGEAMATGVICVATNVGDSAILLGTTGIKVPPGSPEALAEAILSTFRMSVAEREKLSKAARERIVTHFSLGLAVKRFEELYRSVLAERRV